MSADYFRDFPVVRYEGPASGSDFAYRWYDKDRIVLNKRMEDHLRFAVCLWHCFCWPGSDVFGAGTFDRPWLKGPMDSRNALANVKQLEAVAAAGRNAAKVTRLRTTRPGMRLVRVWNGVAHVVTVNEAGEVEWNGRIWRSLSEVARIITGTQWSGPKFFGLRDRRDAA